MRILVIEDDAIQALSIEIILRKLGFNNIEKVHLAEKASAVISEFKPHLMLVDINLNAPFSGIDIVKEVQKINDIPVIYITGNSDSLNRKRAGETNYIDYLIKPVHPKVLENLLTSYQLSN
jgi:response regulator of citrate/malate metabolism